MNKLMKQRNLVLVILALIAVAGIVCYLMLGFGDGAQFDGVKRYSAQIADTEFDPETFDIGKLENELSAALGKKVDATVSLNYSSGAYELCISVSPRSYALLIDSATATLTENYPELGIESFVERSLSPAQNTAAVGALAIVLGIVWVLSFVAAGITLGFKEGLPVYGLTVLNTLVVFAAYVLARLDNFSLLVAALIGAAVATLFYGVPRLTTLDRAYRAQGKKDLAALCNETAAQSSVFNTVVLAVIIAAAFIAAAVFTGIGSLLPVGAAVAVVLLVSLVSTGLALPGMWAAAHKK